MKGRDRAEAWKVRLWSESKGKQKANNPQKTGHPPGSTLTPRARKNLHMTAPGTPKQRKNRRKAKTRESNEGSNGLPADSSQSSPGLLRASAGRASDGNYLHLKAPVKPKQRKKWHKAKTSESNEGSKGLPTDSSQSSPGLL